MHPIGRNRVDVDDPADVLPVTLAFYGAFGAFDRANNAELGPHGLNVTQFHVLNVLYRSRNPLPMSELSQLVALRPTNLSGIVNHLVERGLVERHRGRDDARSRIVRVSVAGTEFLEGFLPQHWRHLRELTQDLTNSELSTLTTLLQRLQASVETTVPTR